MKSVIRQTTAVHHLMDLLKVEGLSGAEGDVAACIRRKLNTFVQLVLQLLRVTTDPR